MDRLEEAIICTYDLSTLRAEPFSAAFVVEQGEDGLWSGPPYRCPFCQRVYAVRRNDERAVVALIEAPHVCPELPKSTFLEFDRSHR